MDMPTERHMGAADEVRPEVKPALPDYAQADFDKNLPAWSKLVASGKKSPSDLLATLSTKATLETTKRACTTT